MATNKNAIIRYQALDKCFRNPGKRYSIDDLMKACNDALFDINPKSSGIKKRQVYEDIKFMQDSRGFDAPLDTYKDGRRTFYRYSESNFSINNQPLNEQEAQQLKESLLTLSRFKGMPQFEWMEELTAKLEQSFHLKTDEQVISFEENPFLTGVEHIGTLFNAIVNKMVLKITYKPFGKDEIFLDIHPYHLKQYNNRWFLFGNNTGYSGLSNLPLDRIAAISESRTEFIPNTKYKFDELFDDVIGVTVDENSKVEKIILKIDNELWPYIKTKPLHGSQKVKEVAEDYALIQLDLILNHELESMLLSFGEQVIVEEPEELKRKIQARVKKLKEQYF